MNEEELLKIACAARENSYCPYSGFAVGAALLTSDGEVYRGCNIENGSFSATVCAERTAIFSAVAAGKREFEKLVVVGGKKGEKISSECMPCGVCRQVMGEFCSRDFEILTSDGEKIIRHTLGELLPSAFEFDKK